MHLTGGRFRPCRGGCSRGVVVFVCGITLACLYLLLTINQSISHETNLKIVVPRREPVCTVYDIDLTWLSQWHPPWRLGHVPHHVQDLRPGPPRPFALPHEPR